jgi:four helix bundle protein
MADLFNLKCWQRSRELVIKVYALTSTLKDFGLKDQLQRAAVSSMSNIAEGYARMSSKECLRFFDYSTSSCMELVSLIIVLEDIKLISSQESRSLQNLAMEVYKMVAAFSRYIKAKNV